MMTRAQVAKRLGKSIATVRRLEGVALHPVVGANGVRRFDVEEVERLKRRGGGGASRGGGGPNSGRSAWLRAQLLQRTLGPEFDQEDEEDGGVEDDDAASDALDDAAWQSRVEEVARRGQEAREREENLAERERQLVERENTLSREPEPTAAEALRADPEFRIAMRAQVAQLIEDLDRLPRRVARRMLNDADLALLEALLSDDFD